MTRGVRRPGGLRADSETAIRRGPRGKSEHNGLWATIDCTGHARAMRGMIAHVAPICPWRSRGEALTILGLRGGVANSNGGGVHR